MSVKPPPSLQGLRRNPGNVSKTEEYSGTGKPDPRAGHSSRAARFFGMFVASTQAELSEGCCRVEYMGTCRWCSCTYPIRPSVRRREGGRGCKGGRERGKYRQRDGNGAVGQTEQGMKRRLPATSHTTEHQETIQTQTQESHKHRAPQAPNLSSAQAAQRKIRQI